MNKAQIYSPSEYLKFERAFGISAFDVSVLLNISNAYLTRILAQMTL